ncbi:MAG: pyridoxamine 5'-phosphate oxidase family protein [Candidatus Hydrothermarchaeales archaeon]
MLEKRYKGWLIVGIAGLLLLTYIITAHVLTDAYLALVSLTLLSIAYFTGAIALILGIFYSLLGVLLALPVISSISAYLAFVLSKIHYIIFRVLIGKMLKRFSWYQKLSLKIKNNHRLRSGVERFHSVLRKLGVEKPKRIKFFEVMECEKCGEDIPAESSFCPFCGQRHARSEDRKIITKKGAMHTMEDEMREVRGIDAGMNHEEVEGFIHRQRLIRLGTADRNGNPHVSVLWYVYDGNSIYFSSNEDTKKIRNIKENPSVSILIDSGEELFKVKGVLIKSKAEIEVDLDRIKNVKNLYIEKYFESPEDPAFKELEYYMRSQVFVKLSIDKVASWDYQKWKKK